MATPGSITCPSCQKKFKGKPGLAGKRIKCPSCGDPFVVPGEAAAAITASIPLAGAAPRSAPDEEDDAAYGATHVDTAARCPSCANLMESEDAVICLYCGYNTQTRAVGATKKLIEHTIGERLVWLQPGLLCAFSIFLFICWHFWYCVYLEDYTAGSWTNFFTAQALRFWSAAGTLGILWALGVYAAKRLIFEPTPPEKVLD